MGMTECPHNVPHETVCEKCQSDRDMGFVWRMNRRGELKRVRKDEDKPRVRLAYSRAKRGR